jgi:hypothetical protein
LCGKNFQQAVTCLNYLMRHLSSCARLICNPVCFRVTARQATKYPIIGATGRPEFRTPQETLSMRSDLIFGALTHVNNRYKLCQLASKATRKLHKPNTRLQDTTNEVLDRFKDTVPMDLTVEDGVPAPERRAA